MSLVSHVWNLILLLPILLGPIPFGLSLILASENGKEKSSPVHCALILLTGWCVIETCLGLFLGMIHHLTLGGVLLSESMTFVAGMAVFISQRRRAPLFSFRNLLRFTRPLSYIEALIITSICVAGFALSWRLATGPITEYDSLAYHLPAMANWYQRASFAMLDQFYYPEYPSTYPYNWETLCTLFLMPFHEDFLVTLPNLIAWVLLGISVYSLGREMGAARTKSMGASSLVLTVPIVMQQVNEMHVDLAFAAFFTSALYWTVQFSRTRSFSYLAMFLTVLGMFVGTKTSGIVYGIVLVASCVALAIQSTSLHSQVETGLVHRRNLNILIGSAVATACFLFLGGFWYVKNLVHLGNPLGYVRVEFAGMTLFPGPLTVPDFHNTTLAKLFHFTNLLHWRVFGKQALIHLNVGFLALIAQALFLPVIFFAARKRTRNGNHVFLFLSLLVTAFLYWTTPYSADNGSFHGQITPWLGGQMRFAIPFLAVLAVTASSVATRMRTRDEVIAALAVLASVLVLDKANEFLVAVIILLVWAAVAIGMGTGIAAKVTVALRPMGWTMLVCLFAVFFVTLSFVARKERDARRPKVYGNIMEYIEQNVTNDETIGYILSKRSYLFYGKNLGKKVLYIPANSDTLVEWIKSVREREVGVIAVGPLYGMWKSSKELAWLESKDGPFVRVFGENPDSDPMLFRFR